MACGRRVARWALWGAMAALALGGVASAQMVNPAMDRPGEPFSYYSRPTDELGVMGAPEGTEVTSSGYLYTGYGELMFFAGNPARPIHKRVKTLRDGYLPVIQYEYERGGIAYRFTMFAATLDGKPDGPLVDFVRVQVVNRGASRQTAWFGAAMRYEGAVNTTSGAPDNCFSRPWYPKVPGHYSQPGVKFSSDWVYGFDGDAFTRDGKVMYVFPTAPAPEERMTPKEADNLSSDLKPRALRILPTTPAGFVLYKLPLEPGKSATLDFKLPVLPMAQGDPAIEQMRAANFGEFLERTTDFWNGVLKRGIEISVPEEKVDNTFRASLFYDLMSLGHVDGNWVQTVNLLQYHAFWLRDGSHIVRMYDLSGYHHIAADALKFFATWQQPNGNFVSQPGQYDGWGQTLWVYSQHYALTRDRAFAESVFPSVVKAVHWLEQARAKDPLGLVPVTTPGDNELITGHVTGHDFWALDGLQGAIALAKAVGQTSDQEEFERDYRSLRAAVLRQLAKITAKTGGYIPPGLDGTGGQDWGNLHTIYPDPILPPFSPMVTATLRVTRGKYSEGIMTYLDGKYLHDYLSMINTETELVRGEQKTAIEEFYGTLVHTSSTQAGFETNVRPWGTRDFGVDLAPHGWFATRFRSLVRNMMVREQGDELHLLSAISPEWVRPGQSIVVKRAPTDFGEVNFTLHFVSPTRARLELETHFFRAPKRLVLHLPWFMQTTSVTADGKTVAIHDGEVDLPAATRSVEIEWAKKAGTERMNFKAAVAKYEAEYRERWRRFLRDGTQ